MASVSSAKIIIISDILLYSGNPRLLRNPCKIMRKFGEMNANKNVGSFTIVTIDFSEKNIKLNLIFTSVSK